ncbi:carbohydate-binding domain-containing protein [Sphingomonas sp. LB-2]|uniref:family 20 glycosylhydrolase n=1 Tax=Sphingomonas caeni TaxID=2984949 RepID=UPI00222E221D|nr:family 20 glycosylhydrolase [Sphingomonas caeni]MCW3848029.1 carbohydate-binding domain-containing protein [Sphingomonas caeni]
MKFLRIWVLPPLLTLALAASNPRSAPSQAEFDALAKGIGVRYEIVDNRPAVHPAGADGTFLTTLSFTMPAHVPAGLTRDDFAIYFSFVNRLPLVESDVFQHRWINGDLNRLTLKPGAVLEPGKTYTLRLWGAGVHHSIAFVMPNLYIAGSGVEARVIAATRPVINPETGLETLPFVAPMTDEAKLAASGADDKTVWQTPERAFEAFAARGPATSPEIAILPTPMEARLLPGKPLDLRKGVALTLKGVTRARLAPALDGLGVALTGTIPLEIEVDPGAWMTAEGYTINSGTGGIVVRAPDAAGAGYALRALAQQIAFERGRLRPMTVKDAPRYGFRGLHLDLARNFHSKAEILKLIEAMAMYRFNKLHLHLADDEGWRLQIKALPELTEMGSKRCHDPSETRCLMPQLGAGPEGTGAGNGYLSQADYIEIVRAAAARDIEVIPSLDMPGHSRAAIRSMEARYRRLAARGKTAEAEAYRLVEPGDATRYHSIQNYTDNTLNVCIDQTYRFLDTAVGEIAAMHQAAGQPLKVFHIGADETAGAWGDSPACKPLMASTGRPAKALGGYFIERVAGMLAGKGIRVAGWSDGLGHTDPAKMPAGVQTNIWGTLFWGGVTEAHHQANLGWDVVLSIPDIGYLDMPYVPHPYERGYDWASRGVDTIQVFGFMTGNLPANGALIRDTFARGQTIGDKEPLAAGRGIKGIQAQLWSETVRTDAGVDYMLFPRLIAFAERAWHKPDWEPAYVAGQSYAFGDKRVDRQAVLADWRSFAGRMPVQFGLLDRLGVAYRVTPPGARIAAGKLEANAEYPGMAIEYRSAGGKWQRYRGPVAVRGAVALRTRSADGRRASRIVVIS